MGNLLRTLAIMTVLTVLFVWIGGAIAGRQGAILALVLASGMNLYAYWNSDKAVLKHYRARELGPEDGSRLYAVVAELAPRAGLPMPKVYSIPDKAPNAFATGRNPRHAAVAATEGIVDILDDDELAGVMAHELTHVRNRDILTGTIAATFAGAITMVSQMARQGAGGGSQSQRRANPLAMILIVVAAPLVATILRMALSRTREYAADDGGAEISGRPLGLASALEKISRAARFNPLARLNPAHSHLFIVSPFLGGARLARLFASHPPAEERIRRLQEMARGA